MPPWKADPSEHKFIGLDPLTDAEIEVFQRWVADGAREGNRRDLPRASRYQRAAGSSAHPISCSRCRSRTSWRPTAPTSRAYSCCRFRSIVCAYVRGIEFRANNPRVHHANIRVDATPASRQLDEQDPAPGYDGIIVRSAVYPDGHFLGWTPGQAAPLLPKGLAWKLAPNSDLVLQLHLVPSGKPESIQPTIALYFTDDLLSRTP